MHSHVSGLTPMHPGELLREGILPALNRSTRHGYDARSLTEQFDARPLEIRKLFRGGLDPARTRELTDEMRAAGLPL